MTLHKGQLRAELADQHVVSFFATPDQLASRTAAAIFGVSDAAAITRLPLWSVYANIQFEFSEDEDAEIRVAFREGDGNWSHIGTDCMKVPLDQPTMNFGFLDPPEVSVLHEFGHVLGLLHEHNHPKGIKWNKQSVYKSLCGPPNNWDKAITDEHMFKKWATSTFPVQKPFDPVSIMAYPMPKDWTGLDTDFGHKDSLSAVDKEFIGRLYPFN